MHSLSQEDGWDKMQLHGREITNEEAIRDGIGPKSTQTKVVGITDEMHPYTFFIETVTWKLDGGMHLVRYPYYTLV